MTPPLLRPPLVVRWLLSALLGSEDRRAVEQDLQELFERRRSRDGDREAAAWMRRQWRQYARRLLAERARGAAAGLRMMMRPGDAIRTATRDVRHSVRSLTRTPALSLTIVLTVGLGIGATTAIYGVTDTVLMRPLPYPDAGRLVRVYTDSPPNRWPLSVVDYRALAGQQTSFSQIAAIQNRAMTFNREDVAERVMGQVVTPSYFPLLGISPTLGRPLADADALVAAEPAVVVSHGFWTRHLGADPAAVGTLLSFDRTDYRLVGVLEKTTGPLEQDRDFWMAERWPEPTRKGPFFITAVGRLAPGVTVAAATEELRAINRALFPLWASSYQDDRASWGVMDLKEAVVGDIGPTLVVVLAAVGFVLLIACANAANLLVARTAARGRELAVRAALGASWGRLLQHLLSEAAFLAIMSAAVGWGIAWSGIQLLTSAGAEFLPRLAEIRLDGRVLAFHLILTAGGAVLIGLIPALHGVRRGSARVIRVESLRTTAGAQRVRQALVVAQFAFAIPLLIGAGLLAGSLGRLLQVDPGFDAENLLTAGVLLPSTAYEDDATVEPFWNALLERTGAIPGVRSVALSDARPPDQYQATNNFDLEDKPTPPGASQPAVPWIAVSPGYFDLLGVQLLEGRALDDRDRVAGDTVVVVDQAWARRFFPDGRVVGRRFSSGGCTSCPLSTVVGVVGNVRYTGLDDPGAGTVFYPGPGRFAYLYIRSAVEPLTLLPSIRAVVRDLDRALPLQEVSTVDALMTDSLATSRALALVVGVFATVALTLAIIGVYGVMSYFVQQHAKDISIRMALGGGPGRVVGLVVGRGIRLVAVGIAVGIAGAWALTRFLASVLFEVTATDAFTYLSVTVVVAAVALMACAVPARRAAGIDPLRTLREE